jgi:hypothetical protein
VGQLLGMLVKGDARARIRTPRSGARVQRPLKEIVYRCIGERRKRYESADELIDALKTRPRCKRAGGCDAQGRAPGLHGHPEPPRREAKAAAAARAPCPRHAVGAHERGGARQAEPAPGRRPRGRPQVMEIKRLRAKGHRITLLNEAQFWRLAGRK